ncbi:MurR/RpiR family transcriptional regulator [Candidatus Enterococcus ferrettii]|uniref:MurR/RpiR family transcriptional regulator n=1 Tax=Candidatus Enterococcus ferrettii TaxID=2815324 RepID=A0ABV0EPP2_9ENTE|nr:MurR/RpiR family transcriptional regulator [Enterococcus sp. 665A]MBO1343130.1 MurR/RpiR family transcriptional regulator [Enterococcus sp. 665A]
MYIFQKIEEVTLQNNETRRTVGEFLLNHRDKITEYRMEDVAKLTYTSKPTLSRFAKLMGYPGWKEFVYAFSHETVNLKDVEYVNIDANYPFSNSADPLEIVERITSLQIQSIEDTIQQLNMESLKEAAELVHSAHRVAIYGTSPNNYYGGMFKRKLLGIGKDAVFAELGEAGVISQTLSEQDVAIIISYSGNNVHREPTINLKYLVHRKVKIIGITSAGDNLVSKYSDATLFISSKEKLYSKISSYTTEQSIILLLNLLYSMVFSLDFETYEQNKITSSSLMEIQRHSELIDLSE